MTTDVQHETAFLRLARIIDRWIYANRVPLAVFLITRIGISLVMYLGIMLFGSPAGYQPLQDNLFVDGFVRWDAFRYSTIVENGYTNLPDYNGFRDTSWFPMYPIVTGAVTRIVGNMFVAGLLVSNISCLIALTLLYRLVQLHFAEPVARKTIILLSVFPFSFFFSSMYTESLFTAAVVGAFYFGEKNRWFPAAVCAAVAGATRMVGVSVLVGLALLYLEHIHFDWRRIRRDFLWLGVGTLGGVLVMLLMWTASGNPLQFLAPENTQAFMPFFRLGKIVDTIIYLTPQGFLAGQYFGMDMIHIIVLATFAVIAALSWKTLPRKSYTLWAWLTFGLTLAAWPGFGRYVLPIFPLFITLAVLLKNPYLFQWWVYLSTTLLTILSVVFALWRYVA